MSLVLECCDILTVIDDPEEFHGLPISLQLVGRRFEDEKVLAILEYIETRR